MSPGNTARAALTACLALALTLALAAAAGAAPVQIETTATVPAFAPDLLHGDNGLPPNSEFPLSYGPLATAVEPNGDAVDAHEGQSISYFHGVYYRYGMAFGCGTHTEILNIAPFCGIRMYASTDLTHWRLASNFDTPQVQTICASYCAFPKVIWSPRKQRYLLFWSSDNGANYNDGNTTPSSRWIAEGTTPVGPWTNLRRPQFVDSTIDSYDIFFDHGTAYMATQKDTDGQGDTPVTVEKLNADYTDGTGQTTVVAHGGYGGPTIFQQGRWWYMAVNQNEYFFGPSGLAYLRADNPLGPYRNVDDPTSDAVTFISDRSCGGTHQGVAALPTMNGGTVPVALIDLYVTSPRSSSPLLPERVKHGDWNQAIAGSYWAPLSSTADGHLEPIDCQAATRIPLAHPVLDTPSADLPVQQVDGRVNATSSIEQSWTIPHGDDLRSIRVPVFQRVYMTSPIFLPPTPPATAVDQPLTVQLVSPGHTDSWTLQPRDVSWAPKGATLTLPHAVRAGTRVTLRLTTTATTGAYGVLVGASHATAGMQSASYQAVESGTPKPAPGVQMLLYPNGRG